MLERFLQRLEIAIALLLAVLLVAGDALATEPPGISPQRLSAMLKEGSSVWVVDVRGEASFRARHIEGSLNIPLALLGSKRLPSQKEIVLVDDSLGLRQAREAVQLISKKGVLKAAVLEGGISGWEREGYRLASQGGAPGFPQVTPEELAWAQKNGVALRLYDLRDRAEQLKSSIGKAVPVEGENMAERLKQVKKILVQQQSRTPAPKPEKLATSVLILPLASDLRRQIGNELFGVKGDIRLLDGGYVAWMANPERKVKTDAHAPVCLPATTEGGTK